MPEDRIKRDPMDVLRGPFDPDTHIQTFIHYFEAIITEDGTVLYATPSHLERLIALYCEQNGFGNLDPDERREHVYLKIPDAETPTDWLCRQTGAIAVWYDYCEGAPSLQAADKLAELKRRRIYNGPVPIPLTVDYLAYDDDAIPVIAFRHTVTDIKPLLDIYDLDDIEATSGDVNELDGFIDDLDLYEFLPIEPRIWPGTIQCNMSLPAYQRYVKLRADRPTDDKTAATDKAKKMLAHDAGLRLTKRELMLNLRKYALSKLTS